MAALSRVQDTLTTFSLFETKTSNDQLNNIALLRKARKLPAVIAVINGFKLSRTLLCDRRAPMCVLLRGWVSMALWALSTYLSRVNISPSNIHLFSRFVLLKAMMCSEVT